MSEYFPHSKIRFICWLLVYVMALAALLYPLMAGNDIRWVYGAVAVAIIFVAVFWVRAIWEAFRNRSSSRREPILRLIVWSMGLFFLTGTLLYCRAFDCIASDEPWIYDTRPQFVNAEYLFRSMVESLELFMFDLDGNVFDNIGDHPVLKGWLSVQAVLSFMTTLSFVGILLYSRLKAFWKLKFRTNINTGRPELFVFFGVSDSSLLLAKDIERHIGEKGVILFLETNRAAEEDNSGVDGILNFFTNRGETFRAVETVGGRLILISHSPSETEDKNGDILTEIGALKLKKLAGRLAGAGSGAQLHIFFLSEDEKQNVADVMALHEDTTLRNLAEKDVLVRFYCHARKNGPNRVLEEFENHDGMEVRLVDSSALAVERLKLEPHHHPVNFVRLSDVNPGTVDSEFRALIVGFDEVGQDALGFLCEFGTFVDSRNDEEYASPSPFLCTVVDSRMEALAGEFLARCPMLRNARNAYGGDAIRFVAADCRSADFYEKCLSAQQAAGLNYVVIALGNDEVGISVASRIFMTIRKYNPEMRNVHILVRCYEKDNYELMSRTARHYNSGLRINGSMKDIPDVMEIFGAPGQVYSYSMIVADDAMKTGRVFFDGYASVCKEGPWTWEERRRGVVAKKRPMLDVRRELRRKEMQDKANSLHIPTKLAFLHHGLGRIARGRRMLPVDCRANFVKGMFDAENNVRRLAEGYRITYPALSPEENRLMLNIAKLEHLRWMASHAILGYTCAPAGQTGCDERTRTHNCLRPWNLIDRIPETQMWGGGSYRLYDYVVVETTILLMKTELIKPVYGSYYRIPENFNLKKETR